MRTIFIGDIHGCAVEFQELLDYVGYRKENDRLLLAGDAFTRGPDPVRVWEIIQNTDAEMTLGNHDERLIFWLRRRLKGQPDAIRKPDQLFTVNHLMPVAGEVLTWLKVAPLYIKEKAFLLVHAGINPKKGFKGTTREEFLTIRTWPPVGGTAGPRWHDYYKPDDRILIFGHDAPGGVVVKRRENGSTYLIGLDSGCVYGGALSAYILEEDRIVQIKSKRKYY